MLKCRSTATDALKMTDNKPTLVFATNNAHKAEEIRKILGDRINILTLSDMGCDEDIPENEDTLQGNAVAKARWVSERYGCVCFADDTGLEVKALGGAPGVHTARYAPGSDHDSRANMRHLLANMESVSDRAARFRTVIALVKDNNVHCFEGIVEGHIATQGVGTNGFGYDPVFIPLGHTTTFAQMTDAEKNAISHRARATRLLVEFLEKEYNKE